MVHMGQPVSEWREKEAGGGGHIEEDGRRNEVAKPLPGFDS